jgi:glutamate-1-semialdehyde 2,1-aminomutase
MAITTSTPTVSPATPRSRPPAAIPPSQAAAPPLTPAAPPRARQAAAYRRAIRSMPGGADSNFRAWGEDTIYVDRGEGARVWDLDGNEFVDLRMGYGPAILGHADARVDDHVNERMRRGVSFSLTSEDEISVAELICEMTFCDMARMTVSGTEATMHAIRVARGFTGRDRIVKFEGQYHGVHDYALISVLPADVNDLGNRSEPVRLAWGRGIPEAIKETVIPAVYNDLDGLRRIFEREGDQIAAVIIEPILGNAQGILPHRGFLEGVRAMTREFGALLIFDEVKTGFRVARGGAAELFGITPDLATYAKAMGNGYPAAAFGGRRDVMGMLPKHVSHGGTYAGNRVAAAAATKVLSILRDTDALGTIERTGLAMQAGIGEVIARRGLPHVFTGVPAMFGIMFAERLPADYRGWAGTDHELYDDVARGMFRRGAMPEPDSREPWFLCEAHAEADLVDRVITAFEGSLDSALGARAGATPAGGNAWEQRDGEDGRPLTE